MVESRLLTAMLALVAATVAPSLGLAATAPGFTVEVHATVTDPTRLAFAPDGTLYTGRDNLGSGGGSADPVKIHRIGPGGSPVAEYGASTIPDPDCVVVDVNGDVSGVGSVLVGSFISVGAGGRITEVATDESVTSLFSTTNFDNPADLVIDSGGRLLLANFANPGTSSGVYVSTGGIPTALFTTTSQLAFIAVDATDRIIVSAADGSIRLYSSTGVLIDGALATGMGGGVPIAVGALGDLPSGVFAVNPLGELIHIDFSGTTTVVGTGFSAALDLQFGPDGALYVAEFSNDQVLRIAPAVPSVPAVAPVGLLTLALLVTAAARWRLRAVA